MSVGTPAAEDHDEIGQSRVFEYLRGYPNWLKLLRIFLARYNTLEDLIEDWNNSRALAVAEDFELDVYGELVGLRRPSGMSNDDYREVIITRAMVLRSNGTGPELIAIARRFTASPDACRFVPDHPKQFTIYIPDPIIVADAPSPGSEICLATTAGEGCHVVAFDEDAYFGYSGDPGASGYGVGSYAEEIT